MYAFVLAICLGEVDGPFEAALIMVISGRPCERCIHTACRWPC